MTVKMYQIISDPNRMDRYHDLDIYYANNLGSYELLKKANEEFDFTKIKERCLKLYITLDDRILMIRRRQQSLNTELRRSIKYDVVEAKRILTDLINVTLSEPRSAMLYEIRELIDNIVAEYLSDPRVVDNLVQVSIHDYSTSLHLTNCMLLALGYAHYRQMNKTDMKNLGLIALLHDIGKIEIPDYLLQLSRKLTDDEYEIIKIHPETSRSILTEFGFDNDIVLPAYEHHERLNGTGYPRGVKDISEGSKLISIIDIFEALTSWRPYKDSKSPFDALKIMKDMVYHGELDSTTFISFANSIVGMDNTVKTAPPPIPEKIKTLI